MQICPLTIIASWCFPSKERNSLRHTSKPPLWTFSNHAYMASFGFVLRVYRTETNTEGLAGKLCKKKRVSLIYLQKFYAYILPSLELLTNTNISTFFNISDS